MKVQDYNYHYMSILEGAPSSRFCVYFGETKLWLKKAEGTFNSNGRLYEIENWETVSASDEVRNAVKDFVLDVPRVKELQTV